MSEVESSNELCDDLWKHIARDLDLTSTIMLSFTCTRIKRCINKNIISGLYKVYCNGIAFGRNVTISSTSNRMVYKLNILNQACFDGCINVVKELILLGYKLDEYTLVECVKSDNLNLLQYMMKMNTFPIDNVILTAAKLNREEMVKYFYSEKVTNSLNKKIAHYAAQSGNLELLEFVMDKEYFEEEHEEDNSEYSEEEEEEYPDSICESAS